MMNTLARVDQPDLHLSERQQQIMRLLAEGKSNKEIAGELSIEYGTVKQHLFVLFRKLNVTSRAKAALVAAAFIQGAPKARSPIAAIKRLKTNANKSADQQGNQYVWRLVVAVSVMVQDTVKSELPSKVERDHLLGDLRGLASNLAEALDGQISMLPYGGMLAWFGHPVAHLDDADRAAFFASRLQEWINARNEGDSGISIGIAASPEMVIEHASDLFAAESFRMAAILARHGKGLRWPLSNMLLRKLAPSSIPWLEIKNKASDQPLIAEGVGPIVAIGKGSINQAFIPPSTWGELPFMESVLQGLRGGASQWVSVECWPPAATISLIDAIGSAALPQGFHLLQLRAPSNKRRDRHLESYTTQAEIIFNALDQTDKAVSKINRTQFASGGERLVAILATIADHAPLVIQVFGLKALDAFKNVIGLLGIERLSSRGLLIVAANIPNTGVAQTSVRLLGPNPNVAPFSRVFTMQAPGFEDLPEGIRIDLQALLDDMGEDARDFIMKAVIDLDKPIALVMDEFDLPHHKMQACIQELTSLGLVSPGQDGGFEFRDPATALALQRLCTPAKPL